MTRRWFEEEVNSYNDLKDICYDYELSTMDDVCHADDLNEWVNDDLLEYVRYNSWEDVRNMLDDIPTDYDWVLREDRLEYSALSDWEFPDWKERVYDDLDYADAFDEDEKDDDEDTWDEDVHMFEDNTAESWNPDNESILEVTLQCGMSFAEANSACVVRAKINDTDIYTLF